MLISEHRSDHIGKLSDMSAHKQTVFLRKSKEKCIKVLDYREEIKLMGMQGQGTFRTVAPLLRNVKRKEK